MKSEEYLKRIKQDKKVLVPGDVYWDRKNREAVEFGYMGQTGWAICYEPGDSGGGMQSSFGIKPDNLEDLTEKHIWEMQNKKR